MKTTEEYKKIVEVIPDDINKITKKQWDWLMHYQHDYPDRDDFAKAFLFEKFKLFASRVTSNSGQLVFNLFPASNVAIFFETAQFLVNKLEEGFYFRIYGLDADYYPRALYDKETKHITIQDYPYRDKVFKSLESFQKWYDEMLRCYYYNNNKQDFKLLEEMKMILEEYGKKKLSSQ